MFGWLRRKLGKKQREINVQEHGALMLEELIACSGGKYNPIRIFSSHQIRLAINTWSDEVLKHRFEWYNGLIENRTVLIKKYLSDDGSHTNSYDNMYRDIAVASMMSSHKNVLKILGCCLEFPSPVLVFEYPEKGSLMEEFTRREIKPLPWNVRLKIAKEVADAVTYLHTEFSRTIIHRDLQPSHIFLDENWTAKLSSFGLSIQIPEGETGVADIVCGTLEHAEPEYVRTGYVTENVDVYSFGVIMLRLLTGKSRFDYHQDTGKRYGPLPDYVDKFLEEQGSFTKLIDPTMLNSADEDIPQHPRLQMEAFLKLALRCAKPKPGEGKPHMIDVAKELKRIEKHI